MPVVVTLPPRIVPDACVEVVDKLLSAAELPTVLLKVMLPVPEVTVKSFAPFTVLLNEMLLPADALPVDDAVIELPNVTAPVYVCVPEVVTSPFKVIPVPVTANVPEVTAAKLTAPPVVIVKLLAPVLSASDTVIAPPPLEALLIVSGSVNV